MFRSTELIIKLHLYVISQNRQELIKQQKELLSFMLLNERYQVQEPIGRGLMAVIYRGIDTYTNQVVAIKLLRETYSTDPKFVKRFQYEAKAMSLLQHPNIVQVYDYGHTNGNYFIVMELVVGTNLRRYLRSRGILDTYRAIIIAHDVALGLGAAHRRSIVHRDMKPHDILIGSAGLTKIIDFGIGSLKGMEAEDFSTTGMTLNGILYRYGLLYRSPEQLQGEIVTPAADVYSLGIAMYEMVADHPPFYGDTPVAIVIQHIAHIPKPPSQFNPGISPALETIILRCIEKAPNMRFNDGSELAYALETLM
jgi:eukaryotic-like serine/threonine-protein kinase